MIWKRIKNILLHTDDQDTEYLDDGRWYVGDVNEAMKEESDMKLSKGELAINQLVSTKTNYAKPDELASRLTNIIAEHTFSGWQNQPSVQATIKRDIIIGMAEYAKENDDSSMDPDEYSKFGMEAMKYVEQHFSG